MRPRIHAAGAPLSWKDLPMDTPVEKMFYKKHRTIEDFGVNVKIIPSAYKYCEGGGWTSMKDIFEVGNKQFADF